MYPNVDFLDLESELSDDQRAVRDTLRTFIDREYLHDVHHYYERAEFPKHLIPKLAQLGILGANLTGYGLPGLDNVAYGLAMQEIERGDSGLRSFVSVQGALVMYPIWAFGSEEQKQKWLPRLHTAQTIGCFGLTEPDFGSDPAGMRTTARLSDDGKNWVLNGSKMWITNGTMAHLAVIWAKALAPQGSPPLQGGAGGGKAGGTESRARTGGATPPTPPSQGGQPRAESIYGFLVETDRPGFRAMPQKFKLSMRSSDTAELFLDNVQIPRSNHLPGATELKHALMCLNQARYGIAWGAIGAAAHCYETALNYGRTRIVFGQPLNRYQLYQEKLHWMIREITLMQLLALRVGRMKDAARASGTGTASGTGSGTGVPPVANYAHISLAKQNNVEKALAIARMARDMLGANGISGEYPIMRHLMNLETVFTYEGTNDIHKLIVGERVTGLSAFTVD